MYDNSILVLAVLTVLKNTEKSLSLYQLIKILEKDGYKLVASDHNISDEMKLFRKNFIVMNALYQLKADLLDSNVFMCVSSLKIELSLEYNSGAEIESVEEQQVTASLSQYYLDWGNYKSTGEKEVSNLLNNFWQNFKKYNNNVNEKDKRLDALRLLGLNCSASWKDIQQSYRQLVIVYHPDKGGNSLEFIKIREAYLILKLTKS